MSEWLTFGKYLFRPGHRVRLTDYAKRGHIRPKTKHKTRGTVTKVDEFNCPTVLWDDRKHAAQYHANFIEHVRPPSTSEIGR